MSEQKPDFDRMFRQHYRLIFLYLRNRGATPEQAADLAQDTFTNAYTNLDHFRGESSERTWLFSIAKNLWVNHLRAQSRHKRNAPETAIDDLIEKGWEPSSQEIHFDPLEDSIDTERRKKIWDAISTLPPRMRHCVMLRVGQDKKYREIADAMQISIQTVRSQLSQGRDQLRHLLSDYFEELQ